VSSVAGAIYLAPAAQPRWHSSAIWLANGIDCVSPTTCWVVGSDSGLRNPAVAETTDGGATWSRFSNVPTPVSGDPNGAYALNGISCVTALSCVAVGGLNEVDGTASVDTTTDGGATWTASTDPVLSGIQDLFSVSCLPVTGGLPDCHAAGSALSATGPVELASTDGGATWGGVETEDNTGWLNSISCVDAQHCWAAGSGTAVALVGTSDSGGSWSSVTAETTNEDGSVSCPPTGGVRADQGRLRRGEGHGGNRHGHHRWRHLGHRPGRPVRLLSPAGGPVGFHLWQTTRVRPAGRAIALGCSPTTTS
jgi:hypothetical protein